MASGRRSDFTALNLRAATKLGIEPRTAPNRYRSVQELGILITYPGIVDCLCPRATARSDASTHSCKKNSAIKFGSRYIWFRVRTVI
jgi:hypothetical protein